MNVADQEYLIHLRAALDKVAPDARSRLNAALAHLVRYNTPGSARFQRRISRDVKYSADMSDAEVSRAVDALEDIALQHERKLQAQQHGSNVPYPALLADALQKAIAAKGGATADVVAAFEKSIANEDAFDSAGVAKYMLHRLRNKENVHGYDFQTRDEAVEYLKELDTDLADGVYKK